MIIRPKAVIFGAAENYRQGGGLEKTLITNPYREWYLIFWRIEKKDKLETIEFSNSNLGINNYIQTSWSFLMYF